MYKLKNYKIKNEKLKGGMGEVHHLYHYHWNKDIAMKQILAKYTDSPIKKEMFISECEKWMSLGIHPHIVQCYYVDEIDGQMCAFMEWMSHGSLKNLINSGELYTGHPHIQIKKIIRIALQIALGMSYSHAHHILHLDLKPDNLLLDDNNNIKMSDFGISHYIYQSYDKIYYTPLYCAPEQKQHKQLGYYTDIYNYGVTLLHILVKEPTWLDGVVASMGYKQILSKYAKIPISKELLLY